MNRRMRRPPPQDHAIAGRLAADAGRLLVDLRARLTAQGASGRELGDAGDRAAHEMLVARLAELRPDDAVLSEEAEPGAVAPVDRLAARRVWIVDPLDGTREYGEVPRVDWAVHVALAIDGDPVVGAVALPGRDLTLTTP